MKKHLFSAAWAVVLMAALLSCRKESATAALEEPAPVVPPPSAIGFWTGKYGNGQTLGLNYGHLLRANGTMRAYLMSDQVTDTAQATFKSEGTWSINGLVIKATYQLNASQTHQTEGLANQAFTQMQGTWKGSAAIASGGFVLSKLP